MPVTNLKALVFGSTGAVGRILTHQLMYRSEYSHIIAVVRRHIDDIESEWGITGKEKQFQQLVIDYEKLDVNEKNTVIANYDIAYNCLGTTRSQAGGAAEFKRIDHGYVIKSAQWCVNNGIKHFAYVSSAGANKNSWLLYPQVKGQIEYDLQHTIQPPFRSLTILRPSFLIRYTEDNRPLEHFVQSICKYIYPAALIDVRVVANAMIEKTLEQLQDPQGGSVKIIDNSEQRRIGLPKDPQPAWIPKPKHVCTTYVEK